MDAGRGSVDQADGLAAYRRPPGTGPGTAAGHPDDPARDAPRHQRPASGLRARRPAPSYAPSGTPGSEELTRRPRARARCAHPTVLPKLLTMGLSGFYAPPSSDRCRTHRPQRPYDAVTGDHLHMVPRVTRPHGNPPPRSGSGATGLRDQRRRRHRQCASANAADLRGRGSHRAGADPDRTSASTAKTTSGGSCGSVISPRNGA